MLSSTVSPPLEPNNKHASALSPLERAVQERSIHESHPARVFLSQLTFGIIQTGSGCRINLGYGNLHGILFLADQQKLWGAALDRLAVVLPQCLQEKIAEEAGAMEKGGLSQPGIPGHNSEERKVAERKMRRASIAVGVMSAIAKQGALLNAAAKKAPASDQCSATPKEKQAQKKTSIKESIKQNFRSSIFAGGSPGLIGTASGLKAPFLDSQLSIGASSPAGRCMSQGNLNTCKATYLPKCLSAVAIASGRVYLFKVNSRPDVHP